MNILIMDNNGWQFLRYKDISIHILIKRHSFFQVLRRQLALGDEGALGLFQRLHAHLFAGLDDRFELEDLFLPDHVPHRLSRDHDLEGRDPTRCVPARIQFLRDDTLDRLGQHDPDLGLLVLREHVDDPGDGLGCAARVEGTEHQVTGLGRGERERDRLQVAHLAHQDVIRILP